jgi:alpha-methylacyl-CoA racemase
MGPLQGVKVLEVASIGPGPFAAMMLADMGADVLRVLRADQGAVLAAAAGAGTDTVARGRSASIPVDLKDPAGIERTLALAERADALVEGMRPGVMERLGLGPDVVLARNPRLVYGRMTGYGQDGPMAAVAGHDINYISIAGALGAIRREGERPLFPLNLLADYGGGGMLLAFGIVCALLEARSSGRGQVIDAAMVDGAALLTNIFHGLRSGGLWQEPAGRNVLDSGAHFYEVYETADGGHVAVGALEPQFYVALLGLLEIPVEEMPQWERDRWPEFKARLAGLFRSRTRAEWSELLEHADACATVVLGLAEAPEHPHNRARGTFIEIDGVVQPGPAPRFSRTTPEVRGADPEAGLGRWGLGKDEIAALLTPAG